MSDLMADLRAAAEKDQPALLYAPSVKRLLALLEAGRACRDSLDVHVNTDCEMSYATDWKDAFELAQKRVEQYDEAAK